MLGEKARPQIIRYDPGNIVYSAAELTKIRPTFAMVRHQPTYRTRSCSPSSPSASP